MSQAIGVEFSFWGFCFLAGAFLTFIYDLVLISRKVTKSGRMAETMEDILFWIFAAVFLFGLLYKLNNGVIRWFAILGFCMGMLVYKKIIKDYFVDIMSTFLDRILHMVVHRVRAPLKVVKSFICKAFEEMKKRIFGQKKKLTSRNKKGNMDLCKHLRRQRFKTEKEKADEPYEKKKKKKNGQSRIPDGCTCSRNDACDDFCQEYSAK